MTTATTATALRTYGVRTGSVETREMERCDEIDHRADLAELGRRLTEKAGRR